MKFEGITIAVTSLIKGSVQSKKAGVYFVVFCAVLFMAYLPLHNIAAKFGG